MIKLKRLINEDEATIISPTGNDDLSKAMRIRDLIKHNILSLTMEDVIRDPNKAQKILDQIDKVDDSLSNASDKAYDSDDFKLGEKFDKIKHELTIFWNFLSDLHSAAEKISEIANHSDIKL